MTSFPYTVYTATQIALIESPRWFPWRMGSMELSAEERSHAASALEEILEQIEAGDIAATPGQRAYIMGTVAGLRGRLDDTGE